MQKLLSYTNFENDGHRQGTHAPFISRYLPLPLTRIRKHTHTFTSNALSGPGCEENVAEAEIGNAAESIHLAVFYVSLQTYRLIYLSPPSLSLSLSRQKITIWVY